MLPPGIADETTLVHIVTEVNRILRPARMKLRQSAFDGNGDVYYGIINMDDDKVLKDATEMTQAQADYFHNVVVQLLQNAAASKENAVVLRSVALRIKCSVTTFTYVAPRRSPRHFSAANRLVPAEQRTRTGS